jgi:hypothetical protein
MPSYLKLETDRGYRVALRYPFPRPARPAFDGSEQVRWTLSDGHSLYTPQEFAREIERLGIAAGEEFEVRRVRENGRMVFRAAKIGLSSSDGKSTPFVTERSPVRGRPEPPRLERSLKSAVAAAARAESEATKIGYAVKFTSADIADMAISIYGGAHG